LPGFGYQQMLIRILSEPIIPEIIIGQVILEYPSYKIIVQYKIGDLEQSVIFHICLVTGMFP
jgi:hypothetical protein